MSIWMLVIRLKNLTLEFDKEDIYQPKKTMLLEHGVVNNAVITLFASVFDWSWFYILKNISVTNICDMSKCLRL